MFPGNLITICQQEARSKETQGTGGNMLD